MGSRKTRTSTSMTGRLHWSFEESSTGSGVSLGPTLVLSRQNFPTGDMWGTKESEVLHGAEIGHPRARHKGRRKRAGCQSGSEQEGQYEPLHCRKGMQVGVGKGVCVTRG